MPPTVDLNLILSEARSARRLSIRLALESIAETHPQDPINPYGQSKLMVEKMLQDAVHAWGLQAVSLRYFNAAGADLDCRIGEQHIPETHLIPLVLEAAMDSKKSISIFGQDYPTVDGTCVRDYIHVQDLCRGHLLALLRLLLFLRSLKTEPTHSLSLSD